MKEKLKRGVMNVMDRRFNWNIRQAHLHDPYPRLTKDFNALVIPFDLFFLSEGGKNVRRDGVYLGMTVLYFVKITGKYLIKYKGKCKLHGYNADSLVSVLLSKTIIQVTNFRVKPKLLTCNLFRVMDS